MRVATYSRVSTEEQAQEGYSLKAQEKRMRAYARSRGWEIVGEYVERGQSGRSIDRPEYLRMMDESESWDLLLIWKLDRIHRDSLNFARMMEAMKKADKEFVSIWENFDSTTMAGRFAMDIIMRIAQLESEILGERVTLGMKERARKGGYVGRPPYGYIMEEKELVPAEGQAQTVSWIYSMRYQGETIDRIAYRLNMGDIQTQQGKKWTRERVGKILRNPTYAGFVHWDGIITKGRHKPLVSREIWETINGQIRTTEGAPQHPHGPAERIPSGDGDGAKLPAGKPGPGSSAPDENLPSSSGELRRKDGGNEKKRDGGGAWELIPAGCSRHNRNPNIIRFAQPHENGPRNDNDNPEILRTSEELQSHQRPF